MCHIQIIYYGGNQTNAKESGNHLVLVVESWSIILMTEYYYKEIGM